MTLHRLVLSCLIGTVVLGSLADAETNSSWSAFHGVDSRGDAGAASIPSTWSEGDYAWRRNLGSRDVGSPIVHDGKVYLLASMPESKQIVFESLDLETGKVRWQKKFPLGSYHLHKRNTYAAGTPSADDDYVFVSWADSDHTMLKCFDHDGNEVWSRDFGSWVSSHGFGTSPRIFGSMVLLLNSQQAQQLDPGQSPGNSRMIAVDRKSGETVWETPLTATRVCYGVPAIYKKGGTTQIVSANTGEGLFGLDPETGKMLWNLRVFDKRVVMSTLIAGDIAISSCGSGAGGNYMVGVRIPSSEGEKPEEVFRMDRNAPYVPTSVLKDNRLYLASDSGFAKCLDAQTGETIWTKRLGGNFGASPILVGEKLLFIDLAGKATLVRASDRFEKLGEVDLGGRVGATPAFAEGKLLLRVDEELRCLGAGRS